MCWILNYLYLHVLFSLKAFCILQRLNLPFHNLFQKLLFLVIIFRESLSSMPTAVSLFLVVAPHTCPCLLSAPPKKGLSQIKEKFHYFMYVMCIPSHKIATAFLVVIGMVMGFLFLVWFWVFYFWVIPQIKVQTYEV